MLFVTTLISCKTINPGEVGIVVRQGVIQPGILAQGRHHFNAFTSNILTFNTRITEYSTIMSPPTKEGLEVKMNLTVVYHIKAKADQVAKLTKLELQTKREQEDFDIETREKELRFSLEKQKKKALFDDADRRQCDQDLSEHHQFVADRPAIVLQKY